jgi:rSAM/selenodomain-associated transferase 1
VVLVVAKAPVPGQVKTRMCPPLTANQAAGLAAASLIDTLAAALAAVHPRGDRVVVSLAGSLDEVDHAGLVAAMDRCTVIEQVGDGLGERLRDAHEQASRLHPGLPVVQVGMDTPQVTADLLRGAAALLAESDAVLGPASDGGWWLLGTRTPRAAAVLPDVPMSAPDTGHLTHQALTDLGLQVAQAPSLTDIDTYQDAIEVRRECPGTAFAAAFDALGDDVRDGRATESGIHP